MLQNDEKVIAALRASSENSKALSRAFPEALCFPSFSRRSASAVTSPETYRYVPAVALTFSQSLADQGSTSLSCEYAMVEIKQVTQNKIRFKVDSRMHGKF